MFRQTARWLSRGPLEVLAGRFNQKYYGRALRTDRHRFVIWSETATGRIVERELYDHAIDPLESRNVAKLTHYRDRVKSLERRLNEAYGID